MSDILIRGIELPIFEHQSWDIRHCDNGKWYIVDRNAETTDGEWHEIVPVPPHGDLIDRDALRDNNCDAFEINGVDGTILAMDVSIIDDAPTIIPASE